MKTSLTHTLRLHWRGLAAGLCLLAVLHLASLGPLLALSRKGYASWLPGGIVRAYAFPRKALSRVPGIGRLVNFYVDAWLERFDVRDATI